MKVTWGAYPMNIGHTDFPGCFRCHDGGHNAKDGKSITQDCNACHNLLAMEEAAAQDPHRSGRSRKDQVGQTIACRRLS